MDDCVLFRKDKTTRQGGRAALYVSEQLGCIKLTPGEDDESIQGIWVRIKGHTNMNDIIVSIC